MPSAASTSTRRRPTPRVTPKGLWGPWLREQRLARKQKDGSPWRQQDAFDFLRERMGWGPTSRASYLNLEHGTSEPDEDQQRVLVELYKAPPPEVQSEAPATVTEPGVSDYLSRIDQLVAQLAEERLTVMELIRQNAALMVAAGIARPGPKGQPESAELEVADAEAAAARSTSTPRSPSRMPTGGRSSMDLLAPRA